MNATQRIILAMGMSFAAILLHLYFCEWRLGTGDALLPLVEWKVNGNRWKELVADDLEEELGVIEKRNLNQAEKRTEINSLKRRWEAARSVPDEMGQSAQFGLYWPRNLSASIAGSRKRTSFAYGVLLPIILLTLSGFVAAAYKRQPRTVPLPSTDTQTASRTEGNETTATNPPAEAVALPKQRSGASPGLGPAAFPTELLVHPMERVYFAAALLVSLAVYLALLVSLVGIVYLAVAAVIAGIVHGLFVGAVRGNGVRVSERQFPEVHRLAFQLAEQMALKPPPTIYVVQAGGLLNAFATRFLGRSFVIIYSDVFELAYSRGEAELAFVICHELAHLKRRHLTWRWLLYPSLLVPFLGAAYLRACEYTCDRVGAYYQRDGWAGGLLVLAAGKGLVNRVNPQEYCDQVSTERGFWIWCAEALSTHPYLPKRLGALVEYTGACLTRCPS